MLAARDDARTGHKRQHRVPTAHATQTNYWQQEELLALLKQADPTGFAPQQMPELRVALLNIAFTQNPALKATLRRASSTQPLSKQSGDQDLPPTISTACSTSPLTPVTRSPHAFLDERPAQQESAKYQSLSRSSPNEPELKQLKQQQTGMIASSGDTTRFWRRERGKTDSVLWSCMVSKS